MTTLRRGATLAGLTAATVLAGGLTTGGAAQAGPGRWTGNAHAEARPAVPLGQAARKPLRAERRTDIDQIACGPSVDQPGGGDTTITVTYNNCADTSVLLAPSATASDGSGTVITWSSACQEFLPGEAWYWEITPDLFARRPTFLYHIAPCR